MSDTVKFEKIYLGTPDGETEAQNQKFEELFCDVNNKYSEIINSREKFMIIGSKGSGKTYLANYICKKAKPNQRCKIIKSQDFLLDRLMNIDPSQNESSGYIYALCRWFILDKIAKYIIKLHPLKAKYIKFTALNKLYRFTQIYENDSEYKNIKSTRTDFSEKEKARSLEGSADLKKASSDLGVGRGSSKKKTRGTSITIEAEKKRFYELLTPFENKVFKALSKKDDIILIFDDLDELDKSIVNKPSDNDI
ncbi:MAG: FunZ family protein, partial [Pelosinus sp.]|nr:FunZ family protein [Pelosinus sp.]